MKGITACASKINNSANINGEILKYAYGFSVADQDNLSESETKSSKIKKDETRERPGINSLKLVPLKVENSYPVIKPYEVRKHRTYKSSISSKSQPNGGGCMVKTRSQKLRRDPPAQLDNDIVDNNDITETSIQTRSKVKNSTKEDLNTQKDSLEITKNEKIDVEEVIVGEEEITVEIEVEAEEDENKQEQINPDISSPTKNNTKKKKSNVIIEESPKIPGKNSHKIWTANQLKQYRNKYKSMFLERRQGQLVSDIDAMWIRNIFARLRCDALYVKESDTKVMEKTTEYCSVGKATLLKILQYHTFIDGRQNAKRDITPIIPDSLKEKVQEEIEGCLKRGFPCNSRYLQDFLKEEGIEASRAVVMRKLKKWGIKYGELKIEDNRKEREYVLANLKNYLEKIRKNNELPEACPYGHQKCDCELKKELVYLDESYIHQNHVTKFGYYLPHAENIRKPLGKGPRIVMVAAICKNGWLGVEHDKIKISLEKYDESGTHHYGSIKYWISNSRKKDYHRDFNQEIFLEYFQSTLLPNLKVPSIIILDNAPYHTVYDKNIIVPSKATKDELKQWLHENNIIFDDKAPKVDLIEIAEKYAPIPENLIKVLADKKGRYKFGIPHEILYLPQYHPELNPIEYAWAQVKSLAAYGPTYNLECLRKEVIPNCFTVVNEERAKKLFNHVYKVEQNLSKNYDSFKNMNDIAMRATPKAFDPSDEELAESDEEEVYHDKYD